jgi:hypothetical protein
MTNECAWIGPPDKDGFTRMMDVVTRWEYRKATIRICLEEMPDDEKQIEKYVVHELCHIHQRKFPGVWKTIFAALGWSVWNGRLPDKFDSCRRYNPDTIDRPLWIFGEWAPIPVFRDCMNPVLGEVDIWFYHVNHEYHVKTVPEDMVIDLLPPSAYEHPREITAYLISEPDRYRGTAAYKIVRQFIDI